MVRSADVVIIGAGLSGLTVAYHLEQAGFFDYLILEREVAAGGLCRSVQQDGFTFDYTGHLLHVGDMQVRAFIEQVMGFSQWYCHERQAFVYSHKRFGAYPFQSNLHGLPTDIAVQCIEGFVRRRRSRGQSFSAWVLQHFGTGLAEHFFFPYQEKIFCYPVRKLSASWMGRFVPATTLTQLIEGAITPRMRENVGYNATFYYPRVGGIHALIKAINQPLLNHVLTGQQVQAIDLAAKTVWTDTGLAVHYHTLINTMPVHTLCRMIHDRSTTQFNRAARSLRASSVLNVNIGVVGDRWCDRHWVYVPEKEYSFYRVGFPHTLSEHMTPVGCSSLSLECAYHGKKPAGLVERAVADCKRLFDITDNDIMTVNVLDLPCAYVTYNSWRERNLSGLLAALQSHAIYSIGRYGAWQYASMQEAILQGMNMAHEILAGQHGLVRRSEQQAHV